MKVYLVSSGEYSDYGIDAVFLDKKKAELYCAARDNNQNNWYQHYIEEWETSDDSIEGNTEQVRYIWKGYKRFDGVWRVELYKYGLMNHKIPKSKKEVYYFTTRENDKELAEKVFYDLTGNTC